ncbi:MAG TPA: hypothetical protein PKD00_01515 [Burkholderiales bacterium]|nr:hypothetical protein [Burkholderiales bacterium]
MPIMLPTVLLFFHEQIFVKCDATSPLNRVENVILMALDKRAEHSMEEYKNTKQVVVKHIIYHKKPYLINVSTEEALKDNTVKKEYNDYMSQINKLKSWKYLKYLPDYINRDEYIEWVSKSRYPEYLAYIHYNESSFNMKNYNGSYIGLGQHNREFIEECGYSYKEYCLSWKVQVYVSIKYIDKYVKRDITKPSHLYAYWLKSGWNGENIIYSRNSVIKYKGKKYKPYKGNKGLDKNNDGFITIDKDLDRIFARLSNVS